MSDYRIGVDFGGSTTKLVLFDQHTLKAWSQSKHPASSDEAVRLIHKLLQRCNLSSQQIKQVKLTGVGASAFNSSLIDIPCQNIGEIQAVGTGSRMLSGLDDFLAVSMGTGTAFVRVKGNRCEHLGGTGVGGGTLAGLAKLLSGCSNPADYARLALSGDLGRVDLKVGDLMQDSIQTLPLDLTAANFGKVQAQTTEADSAAAAVNMIFEVIGVMAILAMKSEKSQNIVLTGTLTRLPQTEPIFKRMSELYSVRFIIPPHAVYATACGAVLTE